MILWRHHVKSPALSAVGFIHMRSMFPKRSKTADPPPRQKQSNKLADDDGEDDEEDDDDDGNVED